MKANGHINRSRSERKRTPKMLATICKLVQRGLSIPDAAEKVHVHHTTLGRWRQEDPEFDEALSAARAAFIDEQIQNIRRAGKKTWMASAWLLERKFPQFFSQPQVQLHMGLGQVVHEELRDMLNAAKQSPAAMQALASLGDSLALPSPSMNEIPGEKAAQVIEIEAS